MMNFPKLRLHKWNEFHLPASTWLKRECYITSRRLQQVTCSDSVSTPPPSFYTLVTFFLCDREVSVQVTPTGSVRFLNRNRLSRIVSAHSKKLSCDGSQIEMLFCCFPNWQRTFPTAFEKKLLAELFFLVQVCCFLIPQDFHASTRRAGARTS